MASRRAASRYSDGNGKERFGAVTAQVAALVENIRDARAEAKGYRDETHTELVALRLEVAGRMDRHELYDEGNHKANMDRIERLEKENLDGAKMILSRVEQLERDMVQRPVLTDRVVDLESKEKARAAVSDYRKWLIGAVLLGGLSVALNAAKYVPDALRYFAR